MSAKRSSEPSPVAFCLISRASRRSPAQRVRREEEEQGSRRSFRRQAETETSGLCDDEPPWAKSLAARMRRNPPCEEEKHPQSYPPACPHRIEQRPVMNMEKNRQQAYEQAVRVLPIRLRQEALGLPNEDRGRAEELRLRCGQPMAAVLPEGERPLGREPVTGRELEQLLELASRASVHTVLDQLRRGYLTLEGGHRVGLCGTAVLRGGEIYNLRNLSSAAVRIARQGLGAAEPVWDKLVGRDGLLESTLILAPPGAGKTTLLRDLIRMASHGEHMAKQRVGVADERGEVAALWNGRPQLDVGECTDVLEGCPKAQALMMLLRAMNPQILAADEITAPEDVRALVTAAGCGAALLATAHGRDREDLTRRPLYRELMAAKVFRRLVYIHADHGVRRYEVEELV